MKRWFGFSLMLSLTVLASIATVGGTTGCTGKDECLPEGTNCSDSSGKKSDVDCCDDNECCYLPNSAFSFPTCNPTARCNIGPT